MARYLFPSPPFPDPKGDVSGSAWEGPDLPRTARGKGVAMTASFRFLASLGCASSSLSPLARCWAIADVLANPGPRGGRCGWGGEYSYPSYPRACSIYNDHTTPSYPAFPRARSWVVVVVVVVGPPPQEKSNGTVQGRCKFLVFPFR